MEDRIKTSGGNFQITMAPKVVTATDEDQLAARIEMAEEENAEVEGDDDDGDEVGMGGNEDGSKEGSEGDDNKSDGEESYNDSVMRPPHYWWERETAAFIFYLFGEKLRQHFLQKI